MHLISISHRCNNVYNVYENLVDAFVILSIFSKLHMKCRKSFVAWKKIILADSCVEIYKISNSNLHELQKYSIQFTEFTNRLTKMPTFINICYYFDNKRVYYYF